MNSSSFAQVASSMAKVKVTHVPAEEIAELANAIDQQQIFQEARAVPCIRKMYSFSHIIGQLCTSDRNRDLDILPIALENHIHHCNL